MNQAQLREQLQTALDNIGDGWDNYKIPSREEILEKLTVGQADDICKVIREKLTEDLPTYDAFHFIKDYTITVQYEHDVSDVAKEIVIDRLKERGWENVSFCDHNCGITKIHIKL